PPRSGSAIPCTAHRKKRSSSNSRWSRRPAAPKATPRKRLARTARSTPCRASRGRGWRLRGRWHRPRWRRRPAAHTTPIPAFAPRRATAAIGRAGDCWLSSSGDDPFRNSRAAAGKRILEAQKVEESELVVTIAVGAGVTRGEQVLKAQEVEEGQFAIAIAVGFAPIQLARPQQGFDAIGRAVVPTTPNIQRRSIAPDCPGY